MEIVKLSCTSQMVTSWFVCSETSNNNYIKLDEY